MSYGDVLVYSGSPVTDSRCLQFGVLPWSLPVGFQWRVFAWWVPWGGGWGREDLYVARGQRRAADTPPVGLHVAFCHLAGCYQLSPEGEGLGQGWMVRAPPLSCCRCGGARRPRESIGAPSSGCPCPSASKPPRGCGELIRGPWAGDCPQPVTARVPWSLLAIITIVLAFTVPFSAKA